jgi:hypothetical protein
MKLVCALAALHAVAAFVPLATTRRYHQDNGASLTINNMRASGIVVENEDFGFEEIQSIDSRLDNLELDAPDVLGSFYEPHLKSFSIKPGSVEVR